MLALLPLLMLLPMCGGESKDNAAGPTDSSVTGTTSTGTSSGSTTVQQNLRVFLTDKPADEYSEVWVTVAAIRIHQSGDAGEQDGGWQEIAVAAGMPVDLLVLRNGVLLGLGSTLLPAGHYQQIRLVLTPNSGTLPPFNNYVVTPEGRQPIDVSSGTIKIVHQFSLEAAQVTDLTLDFDASQSIKKRGNGSYFMQPVVKASSSTAD